MEDSSHSLLAAFGRLLAPVFRPLGFDDWRIATSLVTGFSAKEAVISTLSVLTGTSLSELGGALSSLFSPLSAVSFLVFTLLYTLRCRRHKAGLLGCCHAGRRAMQCLVAWAAGAIIIRPAV